jgi:hypothetical protein
MFFTINTQPSISTKEAYLCMLVQTSDRQHYDIAIRLPNSSLISSLHVISGKGPKLQYSIYSTSPFQQQHTLARKVDFMH